MAKHTYKIRRQLGVFDHFVGLALKWLMSTMLNIYDGTFSKKCKWPKAAHNFRKRLHQRVLAGF